MTINLAAEETEFQSVLARWCSEKLTSEYVRKRIEQGAESADASLWQELVELGLFEVFADAENELSTTECMLLIQEFGRTVIPEAASEQLVFGAHLFSKLGQETRKAIEALPGAKAVASGAAVAALPYGTVAAAFKKGVIEGSFEFVPACSVPTGLLFVETANGVFAVDLLGEGVTIERETAVDLTRAFLHIECKKAAAVLLEPQEAVLFVALKQLLVSHEISGICKWVEATTLEYVKTRKQFGKAVGSFQAVQHMLADMHMWREAIDSLALFAAWAFDDSEEQRVFAAEAAARLALEKGRLFIEKAIQAHGGIGFTWEYDLHLYLRRVLFFEILFDLEGDSDSRLLEAASKL